MSSHPKGKITMLPTGELVVEATVLTDQYGGTEHVQLSLDDYDWHITDLDGTIPFTVGDIDTSPTWDLDLPSEEVPLEAPALEAPTYGVGWPE